MIIIWTSHIFTQNIRAVMPEKTIQTQIRYDRMQQFAILSPCL